MARNPRSVRFPPALEEQVQQWADEHRMPFNRAVVELISRAFGGQQAASPVESARPVLPKPEPAREPVKPPTTAAELARAATSLAEEKGRSVSPDWRKK